MDCLIRPSGERRRYSSPYVWKQEANWEPLWESIRAVAEKRLAGVRTRPHFLGTVVLDQLRTPAGKVHVRQIIDGQQRLATLQVVLAAARDLCHQLSQEKYSDAFRTLTDNHVPLSEDPIDTFKVWPTNADREEYNKVMTAGSFQAVDGLPIRGDALIKGAYLYFAGELGLWLLQDKSDGAQLKRLESLYTALREDLTLVVIDLDENDDAQEIFETLNALGTPLLPADLVKNYLFHLVEAKGENAEKFYHRYWETFDDEKSYWRQEVRQGRLKRARLDLFLNHYLTMMKGEEVIISQMFLDYRDLVESRDGSKPSEHMEHFRSFADVYEGFDNFSRDSREGLFFHRLEQMDIGTAHPLLLEVVKQHGGPQKEALEQALTDLESFFVRRAVSALTTKNYNRFFAQMVARLRGNNNDFSPPAIQSVLAAEILDTQRWPNDDEFRDAWMHPEFYKRVKRATLRVILEAIESTYYNGKPEKIKVQHDLTIEHLLPQDWEQHWPLVVKVDTAEAHEQARRRRKESIHRIGNLTLLTKRLNPSVSNGPWAKKRPEILKHSVLMLNHAFQGAEVWNEDTIDQRAKDLFDTAVKIWPHPGKRTT
jgi:hypothetical protein